MAKKRGNGEGGITLHKKSGLYMARYTVQTATGAKRKTLYGKTRREVDEKHTKNRYGYCSMRSREIASKLCTSCPLPPG